MKEKVLWEGYISVHKGEKSPVQIVEKDNKVYVKIRGLWDYAYYPFNNKEEAINWVKRNKAD